ncbi:MAG: hypothetical protein SAJ37_16890 [Oscillatoria sp. PMC 1068.18]|nr:hypothetical protein [Oscillatoria sp. PMC 1076.18]MEC4990410.1 hypothetical protein [Oscillatoria sp. PMC 1068.18]
MQPRITTKLKFKLSQGKKCLLSQVGLFSRHSLNSVSQVVLLTQKIVATQNTLWTKERQNDTYRKANDLQQASQRLILGSNLVINLDFEQKIARKSMSILTCAWQMA